MRFLKKSKKWQQLIMPICLFFGLGFSGGASAEEFPGWFSAYISGSDRLALYAAGRVGAGDVIPRLVYQTGGLHKGGMPQIISRDVSVRPILYYDTNFNGGFSKDPTEGIFGTISDDALANDGWVAGVSIAGGVLASYRTGSTLLVNGAASIEGLLENGMRRAFVSGSACAEHHLGGWTWLDACVSTVRVLRNYDAHVTQHDVSVGPTVVYETGGLDQQFSLRLSRSFMDEGPQNAIEADWIGAFPNIGAVNVGMRLAEELEGENTRLRGAEIGLVRPIADRPVRIDLGYHETGGSPFLGQMRKDQVVTASIRLPINDKFRFSASVARRNSNIEAYEETITRVNFELVDW